MKADHRKELQTNLLADQLGKVIKKTSSSWNTIGVVAVLILALGIAFWWWSGRTEASLTAAWVDFWQSRSTSDGAEQVLEKYKGTSASRAANLAKADALFQEGYDDFFRSPERAREKFLAAADVYKEVSKNPGHSSDLEARGLFGQGKCHEWLGEVEKAKKIYGELKGRFSTHVLAGEASRRLELLKKSGLVAFYKDWPARLPAMTPVGPPEPPTRPEPPLPTEPSDGEVELELDSLEEPESPASPDALKEESEPKPEGD